MSVSLTGKDTISIGTFGIFENLADGDTGMLDFPNNIAEGKVGKNGNVIVALNQTGKTSTLTLRVILGSAEDKYLNAELNSFIRDPASYVLMDSEIVKRVGDGAGNVNNIIYPMKGGFIQKYPNVKENVEGDTEQSVAVWVLYFSNTDRAIA